VGERGLVMFTSARALASLWTQLGKEGTYSFISIAISVPFPTPDGPAMTIGRIT
jgi:hypothetical protein